MCPRIVRGQLGELYPRSKSLWRSRLAARSPLSRMPRPALPDRFSGVSTTQWRLLKIDEVRPDGDTGNRRPKLHMGLWNQRLGRPSRGFRSVAQLLTARNSQPRILDRRPS